MERQGKGTNGFIILAKYHTEKKIMRIKYLQQNFYWCYTTKQEKQSVGKGEKDETEKTRKCFGLSLKIEQVGRGWKSWTKRSENLGPVDWKGWTQWLDKELNPEGRSWIKWLYEFSSLVSLWWSSSWCLGCRHSTAAAWLLLALAASDLVPAGGRCR